jgi:magnesium-transporting ATPase (P-type)
MIDPVRAGAREAIRRCRRAGIQVWMITGDHPTTALSIARDLGLARHRSAVVTGSQLEGCPPEQVGQLIAAAQVFARMAPHQKLQLVKAAQAAGHVVAVTGDGANDAPALRTADIGVAMGRGGTDVAREAAELVLADDNFATIVAGVEEGRIAYANVRKVITLLVSTGAAEIVLIGLAVAGGLPLPLLPVQLLWLNLVTNGIQDVALAFEPGEGDVLRRPPRPPREPIFNSLMIGRTLLAAAVMGGVAFGTFFRLLDAGWGLEEARNVLLLLMVLFENVHLGNCRSETRSVFRLSPLRSPVVLIGTAMAVLLHVLMMHLPIGHALLGTGPVNLVVWLRLIGLSLSVLVVIEIDKARRAGVGLGLR